MIVGHRLNWLLEQRAASTLGCTACGSGIGFRWFPNDCAPLSRRVFLWSGTHSRRAEIDVADRPQDQPKPVRTSSPAATRPAEIGAREVMAYLRQHPDFLERHPDALQLLRAPARQS